MQVVERAKSPGLVPVNVTAEMVTVLPAPEVLVMVTICEGLDAPTVNEPNVKEAGASETVTVAGLTALT